MKTFVAVLLGLASGFVLCMMLRMVTIDPAHPAAPGAIATVVVLLGGWVAVAVWLARGARTVRAVLRRAFLLGAIEWVMLAIVGWIFVEGNAAAIIAGRSLTGATADAAMTSAQHTAWLVAAIALLAGGGCWLVSMRLDPERTRISF